MKRIENQEPVVFADRVFSVEDEDMPKGAWWWWFWLFFFENPKDPNNPRQLMILWSTRKVKRTCINGMEGVFKHPKSKRELDVVAAWYFDGERMNHNWILEQCPIRVNADSLVSESKVKTSFHVDGDCSTIRIGEDMEFIVEHVPSAHSSIPTYSRSSLFLNWGYSIIRLNRADIRARIGDEYFGGTSYFQRVFVNSPGVAPWYWGIFHFPEGQTLQYFMPHFLGKKLKKDITFFDGKKVHRFSQVDIKRLEGDIPSFSVLGKNGKQSIKFTVIPYSHSSWTFDSNPGKIGKTTLVYNEYPAKVSDMVFEDGTGSSVTCADIGEAVGNAEYTTGFLL